MIQYAHMEIMKAVILIIIGIGAYLFVFDKDKLDSITEGIREFVENFKDEHLTSLNDSELNT